MLQAQGPLRLDPGACAALLERGASLLQVGITAVEGEFGASQAVNLVDPDGRLLGRGLCSQSSAALRQALGAAAGDRPSAVVVHRDALVLHRR